MTLGIPKQAGMEFGWSTSTHILYRYEMDDIRVENEIFDRDRFFIFISYKILIHATRGILMITIALVIYNFPTSERD